MKTINLNKFNKKVYWKLGDDYLTTKEGLVLALSKANIGFLVCDDEIQISADDNIIILHSGGTWELM